MGVRGPPDVPVPPNSSVWKSFIQELSFSVRPQCERKPSCWKKTFGVAYAGLQISEIYRDNLYCSLSSLERKRVQSLVTRKGAPHIQLGAILFRPSLDGLSSRSLFSLLPAVTSLHLKKWFCLPAQHRRCLLLSGNRHFAMHFPAAPQSAGKIINTNNFQRFFRTT